MMIVTHNRSRTKSHSAEHSDSQIRLLRCRGLRPGLLIHLWAISLTVWFAALQPCAWAQQLRLTNPISIDRTEEIVEIPLEQVLHHLHFSGRLQSLVATDVATKQRMPSQLYSSRRGAEPDALLLLVRLPAKEEVNVAFKLDPAAPPQ